MMHARASVWIQRPPEDVFAFLSDPSHDRLWRSYLVSSAGPATGRGGRLLQTYVYEGRTIAVQVEIVGFDPPERISYAVHDPVKVRLSLQCRPEGAGTWVSAWLSGEVPAKLMPVAGRIRAEAEQVLRRDLAALKEVLESA